MSQAHLTSLVISSSKLETLCMDGPALKVTMQNKSPLLFPLRRLSRIHIVGSPDCGMNTLLHCAEQSVPVAFFHGNGRLRCCLLRPNQGSSTLEHWLEQVEFDNDARNLYRDWHLNQMLHELGKLGFTIGANSHRHKMASETLRGTCNKLIGKDELISAQDWLEGLLQCHLEQLLDSAGMTRNTNAKFRLLEDIKQICELPLLHGLASQLLKASEFIVSANSMTALYQQKANDIEFSVKRMLAQLLSTLEELA